MLTNRRNKSSNGDRRHFLQTRVALAIGVVSTFVLAPPLAAQSLDVKKVAFLVGVSKYHKDGFKNLDYCERDVEELATELRKHGFQVATMTGNAATKVALEAKLKQVFATLTKLNKQDVVLLSFSGHGMQTLAPNPIAGQPGIEDAFFCPVDALKSRVDSLISISWVMKQLEDNSGSSQNLVLVDACRDNPARGTKNIDGSTAKELPNKISVLFSSSAGKQSFESDKIKHGIFTHVLLQGLRGEAANRQGQVTWLNLASHVIDEVPIQAPKLLGDPNVEQRPNLLGNLVTQPVLARLDSKPVAKPPLTPPGLLSAPFDGSEAKAAQHAWAAHLKTEPETTNGQGIRMALIPPGEFLMGNDESTESLLEAFPYAKRDWFSDAESRHRVRVAQPFYLGVYEVTKGQFARFVTETRYRTDGEKDGKGGFGFGSDGQIVQKPEYTWRNAGFPQTDDHPVVNVSWNDAAAFCEWLSRKEGVPYRLPTEAEWEYACRAGTTSRYSHGAEPEGLVAIGNVGDASLKTKFSTMPDLLRGSDGYVFTAPSGQFLKNRFGLCDMTGNVMEWCSDWYDPDYYGRSPSESPTGPAEGSYRVLRGGGWGNRAAYCRSANRNDDSPGNRDSNLGFRVARSSAR